MLRCIVEILKYICIFRQIFIVCLINFEKRSNLAVCVARCKIEPLPEVLFSHTNARCKMKHRAGENSLSRAPSRHRYTARRIEGLPRQIFARLLEML
jgi:hypothetical protein